MSEPSPLQPPETQPVALEPARESSLDLRPRPWHLIASGTILVLAIAVLAGGILWYFDRPVLVPVTGRVTCEGKALENAMVMSVPVKGEGTAVAGLDADGRFELKTNGVPGAYTGEHKLLVKAFTRDMPPKPTVPVKYLDEKTTPLTIHVKAGESNHFEFEIEKP